MSAAERAAHLVLAGIAELGPRRRAQLLEHAGSAADALAPLRSGARGLPFPEGMGRERRAALHERWATAAAVAEPVALLDAHRRAGVQVVAPGDPAWPDRFAVEPEPPDVLFLRGDSGVLGRPTVAIVGTRRCSLVGRRVAAGLGRDLGGAGVTVVSGLALGIDGAAHDGVRNAQEIDGVGAAVGVVACGLDRCYPPAHRDLWRWIGERGLLISEAPLGVAPARWRFPARNRLIASLADVVVIVESPASGGAMITAELAMERTAAVAVVPGSVESPVAAGPNALLADGAIPVRDAADVLGLLGETVPCPPAQMALPIEPDPVADAVLAVVDACGAVGLDTLVAECPLPAPVVAAAVTKLEFAGRLSRRDGRYERAGA